MNHNGPDQEWVTKSDPVPVLLLTYICVFIEEHARSLNHFFCLYEKLEPSWLIVYPSKSSSEHCMSQRMHVVLARLLPWMAPELPI